MSTEKIIRQEKTLITSQTTEERERKLSSTVDINRLLARIRSEKQEENKINIIFSSFFAVLILIAGILLSL